MDILIHTGTEKTGTTTIQDMLYRNQGVLSEHGFHYLAMPGSVNCRTMASYCIEDCHFDDYLYMVAQERGEDRVAFRARFRRELEAELARVPTHVHTVIISSEHFHSRLRNATEVGNLRDLIAPLFDRVRIVTYLREQSDLCCSIYSTVLAGGGAADFDQIVAQCHPREHYYNYQAYLDLWARAFGEENLCVRLFDRGVMADGDLLSDFIALLDARLLAPLERVPTVNTSLSHFAQTVLALINTHIPRLDESGRQNPFSIELANHVYTLGQGSGRRMTAEAERRVRDLFQPSNEDVRRRFFPEREMLFDEPERTPALSSEADQAELLDKVFGLLVRGPVARA